MKRSKKSKSKIIVACIILVVIVVIFNKCSKPPKQVIPDYVATPSPTVSIAPVIESTPEVTIEPTPSIAPTPAEHLPADISELKSYLVKSVGHSKVTIELTEYQDDYGEFTGEYMLAFFLRTSATDAPNEKTFDYALRENARAYLTASYEAIFANNLPVFYVGVVIDRYNDNGNFVANEYLIILGKNAAAQIGEEKWLDGEFSQPAGLFSELYSNATTLPGGDDDNEKWSDTCYVYARGN